MTLALRKILVTGATGYIGGRLVPRLLERGYEVRCLARHPGDLEGRLPAEAELLEGNVLHPRDLERAMKGVSAAYYLVHSMAGQGPLYPRLDAEAAGNFAKAATAAGLRRVVYLGALGDPARELAPHLRSRQAVGEILRQEGPPLTEFRSSVIIGSGSLSFELIRGLVERHPVLPSFRWLQTRCQPIAVRDVLSYLIMALEVPACEGRVLEVGGASIHTYEEMLRIYALKRGLPRRFVPLPPLSPRLCAWWLEMSAPIPSGFARPLLQCLKDEVVCRESKALAMFPIVPLDYETAVRYALLRIKEGRVETTWTTAIFPRHAAPGSDVGFKEGLVCEDHRVEVLAPAARVFEVYAAFGGDRGWLYAGWLWRLRALLDRLAGGGAPHLWRVERIEPGKLLLLRAQMRVPGKGWLQFESAPAGDQRTILRVTAYLEPKGFWGYLYWYALCPVHKVLLGGLARAIGREAGSPSAAVTRR